MGSEMCIRDRDGIEDDSEIEGSEEEEQEPMETPEEISDDEFEEFDEELSEEEFDEFDDF